MEHVVTIKKIITGGKGLGHLTDGMVVMVSGVLPGETVMVRETKACRGHREASLLRVLEDAPERVTPPCTYYGRCGGCDLQHAAYPLQLQSKQQILAEALGRAHVALPPTQPAVPLPAPQPFGYRHRLRLHLDHNGQVGFHQRASNQVVTIHCCLLAHEQLNQVIARLVKSDWPQQLQPHVQALELLLCPTSGQTIVVLEPRRRRSSAPLHIPADLTSSLADQVIVAGQPSGRGQHKAGTAAQLAQSFTNPRGAYQLTWDHRCFFQVNIAQTTRLVHQVLALLAPRNTPWTALDLFCGMGTFSIPLGLAGARLTGVEHNRHSILWAERNSRTAGLQGTRFIAADVGSQLTTMAARRETFSCIVLDPPRQGLGRAAALLPQLKPEQIIYISCDPATLARDLRLMCAGGYRVQRVIPVDMFPQTHHIESVTLLERN